MNELRLVEWEDGENLLVADLEEGMMHVLNPVLAGVYRRRDEPDQLLQAFAEQGLASEEAGNLLQLCLETLRRAGILNIIRLRRQRTDIPPHLYPVIRSYRLWELQNWPT